MNEVKYTNLVSKHPGLLRTKSEIRREEDSANRENEVAVANILECPYWYLSSSDPAKVLEYLQCKGSKNGFISFTNKWDDFDAGQIGCSQTAEPFNIPWHQNQIELTEEEFFFTTDEDLRELGLREVRP